MREQLRVRLEGLKNEFEMGQAHLKELDRQQLALRETLLRISGAIQVLEELLAGPDQDQAVPSAEEGNAIKPYCKSGSD